jgi:DNA polymerase elongation subunit (family B)
MSPEVIEAFLMGSDPQKYIVAVEATYNSPNVTLVVNDPVTGKHLEEHKFKPFLWFKQEITKMMYDGNRTKIRESASFYDVKIEALITHNEDGVVPPRMDSGYKFMATCKKSYNNLVNFFKAGGIDIFNKDFSSKFVMFSPAEQFLIQSGKRLFKGVDDYNDVHRFQFDLETEGLFASKDRIFQIGVRDNRGFEGIMETTGNTLQQLRDMERINIERFFKVIDMLKPDVITGYNSEGFDWSFLEERCIKLGLNMSNLSITLDPNSKLKRKDGMIKLGGNSEPYKQTNMYGYNIIDIAHSVRRAQAINSDIQKWNLKYITQYSEIAKPNRVYIAGDKIHSTWADKKNEYAFNEANGDWYIVSTKKPLVDGYEIKTGAFIVQRYLLDDLWETEKIDYIFNQATFLIAKLLPTTYQRSSTMGTAGQWKLIMAAWSYENKLAIPSTTPKKDFTGGLSRLLEVGYAKNVVKLDYAALYPKIDLTHEIFPDLDITGVMEGFLTYVVDTRDEFKFLTTKHKNIVKKLKDELTANKDVYSKEKIDDLEKEIVDNKTLQNAYDKKQLPLKILANSWFGSYGAPNIFNWGDTDAAEETTCRGRQYLRLMVKHFTEKYDFKALVGDSVTFDTPIYIKYKNIIPSCDIFKEITVDVDGQQRDFTSKEFLILTNNGWKDINYVYRHKTNKKMFDIRTNDRHIRVTEDHSIFVNGKKTLPSTLNIGNEIDVVEVPIHENFSDITKEKAWLLGIFVGDGSSTYHNRKVQYFSKRQNKYIYRNSIRPEWTLNNQNLELLEKAKLILFNEFNVTALIKDYMVSSSTHKLKSHFVSISKWFSENCYTSFRQKKIPTIILNSSNEIKKSFLDGFICADGHGFATEESQGFYQKSITCISGLTYLYKCLGLKHSIGLKDTDYLKRNLMGLTINTPKYKETKINNIILWKKEYNNGENFVYDVSTKDGSFIAGVNGVSCSNTDGFNFSFPDNINEVKYMAKGSHWKTTEDAGKELSGLDAVLAEFNENYMVGRMGLDIDDICNSTINFSRKNYANDINGKVKLVGNSVKSKKMPTYIEEFLKEGIRLLLSGKGKDFIECYYAYVNKIYNFNIPLVKIASKSKVNCSMADYRKKATQKNKNGKPMPKQAHMELALAANLEVSHGDMIYYVNIGQSKSTGDIKTIFNKETNHSDVTINCKMIDNFVVESDTELIRELEKLNKLILTLEDAEEITSTQSRIDEITDGLATTDYNVSKYLASFNKKVKPLLICFSPEIRNKILIEIKKDRKTKLEKLEERSVFTELECILDSGHANKDGDQDTYLELMTMEDKEIKFWSRVDKIPNNMEEAEWLTIKEDYEERMRQAKIDGIAHEKRMMEDIIKRLEIEEIDSIRNKGILPVDMLCIADIDANEEPYLISRTWGERLVHIKDLFLYENQAIDRAQYYIAEKIKQDKDGLIDRYELWLDHRAEQLILTGETITVNFNNGLSLNELMEKLTAQARDFIMVNKPDKTKKTNGDEDDEEDEETNSEELVFETEDDFSLDLKHNSYSEEGPIHVNTRPNIKVYPKYNQPTKQEIIEEVKIEDVIEPKIEDEWNF